MSICRIIPRLGLSLSTLLFCGGLASCCPPAGVLPPNAAGPVPEPMQATLVALDGSETNLAAFQGQVMMVDFWASWCAPCRMAFPYYVDIYNRRRSAGFEVLAVSIDESLTLAKEFSTRWGLPFKIFHDSKGEAARAFSVSQIPASFILDKHGRVRFVHRGFDPQKAGRLEEEIMLLQGEQ